MKMLPFLCYCCLVILTCLFEAAFSSDASDNCNEGNCKWLVPGLTPRSAPEMKHHPKEDSLSIYCYRGESVLSVKAPLLLWSSVEINIISTTDSFDILYGNSSGAVTAKKEIWDSSWIPSFWDLKWKTKSVVLVSPYGETCFGIVFTISRAAYYISTSLTIVHWHFPLLFGLGIFLFFLAGSLSKNSAFFYTTGVSAGTLASILVLVYVLSRFIPHRSGAYAVLVGGWALCAYLLKWLSDTIRVVLLEYPAYVAAYFVSAALISFCICYYIGPPTEKRRQDLVKWTIQLMALILLYQSTQSREASATIIVLVISIYFLPPSAQKKVKSYWLRLFPHKIRLLTEEEYRLQGIEESKKALEELRKMCQSSDFDAWGTVQKLKDPMRFARFLHGENHVSESEMKGHESEDLFHCSEEIKQELFS